MREKVGLKNSDSAYDDVTNTPDGVVIKKNAPLKKSPKYCDFTT